MDVQYLDVVGLPDYAPCELSEPTAVLIVAGYVGDVRLKDNLPLHYDSVRAMEEDGLLN
jgi:pantothenate synthetase